MSAANEDEKKAREKVERLVRNFRDAVLVTVRPEGLHGRPMLIAGVDDGPILWFLTRSDSAKVDEIIGDHRGLAIMKGMGKYLCVQGRADVLQDEETARRLWSENHRIWFTGPEDLRLVLVRLQPASAEYWDQSGVQGLKFAVDAAKAYVKGEQLKDRSDVEQHGKVEL
jgi:general stress protein 26